MQVTRFYLSSSPIIPIQAPEVYGLAQMPDFDVQAAVKVGDGAGDFQDAVVGRALLADVGREVYFDSTIFLPVTSVYFLILLSKLSILSVDRTLNYEIIFEPHE